MQDVQRNTGEGVDLMPASGRKRWARIARDSTCRAARRIRVPLSILATFCTDKPVTRQLDNKIQKLA